MTESLEPRQLLSSTRPSKPLVLSASSSQMTLASAGATSDATNALALNNQVQTYATLPDTAVTMTGRSELHITSGTSPITGSTFALNSQDAWLFFDNIKPSVVNSTYRSQITVNGAAAVLDTNVRIVEYGMGAVVIPQAATFQPLQSFTGPNFTGTAKSFSQYTIYNTTTELAEQFNNISSFKLKRGYMATVATKTDGTGSSKVYVAADNDLDVSILPSDFENSIQFIRVLPWRWVSKKGASDLSPATLNAQWFYNWNNDPSLTNNLDAEYVPIRQQLYWPGLPGETEKNVTAVSGFNEPNNPAEDSYTTLGNGSVDAAIAYWPAMEGTGLRIGAPAVSDSGKTWLYSFMDKAIAAGLRVDYIPIHMYMAGQTATSVYNWLKDVWDRYHKPMWVTEFNNGANWTTAADPTYAQNATVIDSFIQMMDTTPWIERYSIYSNVEAVRQMTYTDGSLTPAGQKYYDNQSPISYVQESVPDSNTGSRAVARLPMDGNLLDASGYGNNGEANGAISYVAGQRGQAALFDGSSSYVRLPANVANGSAFTFAAWVNWDGGANWQRIFDFGDDANAFMALTPSNGTSLRFVIKNGGTDQVVDTAALPIGQWTHVAVTLGSGGASLYVNGVLAATNSAVTIRPGDFSPVNNYLGKSQFAADPMFAGRLDDVQISDVALTGAQIAALMTDTAPQFAAATIARGPALRGLAFSASIAGTATDADAGDSLTYGKASGPAWLTVAANGALGGSPSFDDSGPQEFVVTATDSSGMTSYSILTVALGDTYWRGDVDNVWSTNNAGNTNWATGADGATDTGTVPGASTDIVFSATGAGNLPNTTLGAATSVRSVRVAGSNGVTIGGTQSLTLGLGGLAVVAGAGATTINTSGGVVLGGTQTWTNDSTNLLTVASLISGLSGLTKDGTGTLVLTGNNTFSGLMTIAAGTLQIGDGGTVGSLLSDIANAGVLLVNRSNDVVLGGSITGSGSLIKVGAGRLLLTSVNSYSGGTTVGSNAGAGIIRAMANGALGTGTILIGPTGNGTTARLELANNVTIANAVSMPMRTNASAGVENISGNNALSGTITLNVGGSFGIFQSDAGLLTLGAITTDATGARIPTLTGNGNGLVNGVIANGTGTVGITKSGAGTWTLSAINTYTGVTTLNAGTLAIGGAERIANTSALALGGGTFATNGYSETLGTITLSANSGFNFGSGASTLTFSGLGTLTAGTTLNITNWTQGADHLFVGTTAGLSAAQLAQFRFNGTAAQQLSTGEIVPVTSGAPTIAVAAAANLNAAGTTATLSVLGADDGGEANLTYAWSVTNKPVGAADPTFSVNGTNAAKSSVITFSKAGTYTLLATAQDGSGLTVTSSVNVVVDPAFAGIAAASATIATGTSIAISGADQFGNAMSIGGGAAWSSDAGSITQAGIFTAPTGGATNATIHATVGSTTYTTTLAIVAGRGWYKADATGASLIDSSGAGNAGALSGAYGYVAGRSGNALALSGGAADLPDGIVSGLTDFTIATWIYLDSNASWGRIFDFGTSTTSNMFLTPNAGGNGALRFAITTSGNGAEQRIDGTAIPLNTWTYVAVSLIGNVGTLYVNGVAVGTNTNLTLRPASLGSTTNNFLGDSQYAADPALQGKLDDFRILGAGLNAAGIAALRDEWRVPTIATAAIATPDTVVGGTTADLSVLGASAAGEAGLTYTWSVLGTPPADVTFSANGTNDAKASTATFTASGTYQLLVTITDISGASITSTVTVPVTVATTTSVSTASEAYGIGSHTLEFTFADDVAAQQPDWASLVEIKSVDGTRTIVPTGFTYDAATRTLTVALPAAGSIADDNYTATLKQGTLLSGGYELPFFMLGGDADRDRATGFSDLLAMAKNYGQAGKTYAQGDFTGDGTVNFDDLLLLARNYNHSLAAAATFSNVAIEAATPKIATTSRRTSTAAAVLGIA